MRKTRDSQGRRIKTVRRPCLLRSLSAIAVAAEHLAVVWYGAVAVAPRRDVVGFHFIQLEVRPSERADAMLSLVGLKPRVVRDELRDALLK